MPLVSVIIPVYNSEKFLSRCFDSVLSQTISDFELIVIDDGSTDNSSNICDKYSKQDKRVKFIQQENMGQSVARNRALDIAQGKYIAFVDSDDYINPQMLEQMVKVIESTKADIVVCGFVSGSESDYLWSSVESNEIEVYSGLDFLRNSVLNKTGKHWLLWDKLYKRSCFDDIRLPEGRINEDNATVYKILYYAEKVVVTNNVLYYYFANENSTVNQNFKLKHLDWLLVLEEMIQFFTENHEQEMLDWANRCYLVSLADFHRKAHLNHLYQSVQHNLRKKLYRQYRSEKEKYTVDIHSYPMVIEELFPIRANLYWMIERLHPRRKE